MYWVGFEPQSYHWETVKSLCSAEWKMEEEGGRGGGYTLTVSTIPNEFTPYFNMVTKIFIFACQYINFILTNVNKFFHIAKNSSIKGIVSSFYKSEIHGLTCYQ